MSPTTVTTASPIRSLLHRWREDAGATYQTWFLWTERLKNFRSIRRGLETVVEQIEAGSFGNQYRDSSLETVVKSIAEQRQIFRGADHAFLWKPKLRIPDIYESAENQRAFGKFLHGCACCHTDVEIVRRIHGLDSLAIKGLGPASANLLYFLHPTLVVPSNTAIVAGYNAVTGARAKLGRWQEYLAMREGMLRLNEEHRDLLSNDLGAIAGFLYDVGSGRYPAPPREDTDAARAAWELELATVRAESANAQRQREAASTADVTHTSVQGWLRDLGLALGFAVWIASNDRSREYRDGVLGDGCLAQLPEPLRSGPGADMIRLIDVLWLDPAAGRVRAAFEVEHTTSIYSGIVRLLDLALGDAAGIAHGLFIVAPNDREDEVRAQLTRPAFRRVADLELRYLPYGELEKHREAMARFGRGMAPIEALARRLA